MTYQEFVSHIKEAMQKELGSHVTVTIQNILKNNNTYLDGLTVLATNFNISPTIYLNSYYAQYKEGRQFSDIFKEILSVYEANKPSDSVDVSFFTDYDKVKSRIIFKLINYKRNEDLLKTIPHFRYLDLAIVFNCLLKTNDNGSATILIQNQHLDLWGITSDDLYALSLTNTPRLLAYDLRSMTEVIRELFHEEDASCHGNLHDFDTDSDFPMYMLSNRCKLNGSVCILYQNLLPDFARRLGSDLYILPSSIHEVLIIPASQNHSCEELTDMVREVNATQVSVEEILSDHVYYFSRQTGKLTMS